MFMLSNQIGLQITLPKNKDRQGLICIRNTPILLLRSEYIHFRKRLYSGLFWTFDNGIHLENQV